MAVVVVSQYGQYGSSGGLSMAVVVVSIWQ